MRWVAGVYLIISGVLPPPDAYSEPWKLKSAHLKWKSRSQDSVRASGLGKILKRKSRSPEHDFVGSSQGDVY
jgi:hypothetical protein